MAMNAIFLKKMHYRNVRFERNWLMEGGILDSFML